MGRKKKVRMPFQITQATHWFKLPIKLATHVFTVAGVIVAATPVLGGVRAAAKGDFAAAAGQIRTDTVGQGAGVGDSIKNGIVNVGIPIALGIALVWGGAQLRKRIGR